MEPLDFCRVKKIDEKGFGFLKSLHYPVDIFFHFSQVSKEEFRAMLQEMKRGEFFLFYTSKGTKDGRRKVADLYYSLESVPQSYLPEFSQKILVEFESGRTNIFDLLFVFNEFRKINFLNGEYVREVLSAKRIASLPIPILPFLTDEEVALFKSILKIDEMATKPFWYDDLLARFNRQSTTNEH